MNSNNFNINDNIISPPITNPNINTNENYTHHPIEKELITQVYPVHLQKRNMETSSQFEFRKQIFYKIYNEEKDEERALIYSNIWVNIISLGCTYPREVMDLVKKYKPTEAKNI